jgi:hypothetical protein
MQGFASHPDIRAKIGERGSGTNEARETEMALFKPKYITFDCYGTLTRFRMSEMARDMFADRIAAEKMDDFGAISRPTASMRCSAHGSPIAMCW